MGIPSSSSHPHLLKGTPMAKRVHALITGPGITGRIPVPSADYPEDFIDVTPAVLHFDSEAQVAAVADAIEDEHRVRGTHPEEG
jgi:hypothetical protein